MKGLFIPDITAEMFRNGCLESIEALMAEGKIYDIDYSPWIPVSEKVPEIFADVLCCTDADEIFIAKYWGKMDDGTDCFDDDDGMMQEGDLIAWMPLPQSYKTESEDKTASGGGDNDQGTMRQMQERN